MKRIPFSYAGGDYWDLTRPLIDRTVEPRGLALAYEVAEPADLVRRMCQNAEFDASEVSASSFVIMVSRGDDRLVGVPIFPARFFRHGFLFVNSAAGIERPEQLVARRVGVPQYQQTAALWIRAILQHDHGVKASDIHWFQGGFEVPRYSARTVLDLPPEIRVSTISDERSLVEMLLTGELDALACASVPKAFTAGDPRLRRLFPNYRQVERDYFRRTGLFPVKHMVVVRRDVYEANRWIPNALLEAFESAKAIGWKRLCDPVAALPVSLPWLMDDLEELADIFGGQHPFPYGIDANYAILQALTQYSYEQGLSKRKVEPEELFAPETRARAETSS